MSRIHLFQVAAASLLVLTGCGLQQNSAAESVRQHIVTYRVQADRRVRVCYTNASGTLDNDLLSGVALRPWEKTVVLPAGKMAYLTAKLDSELAGAVMTEILVEGRSVKRSESSGEYAIATAAVSWD